MRELLKQLFKFGIVGGIAFFIDYGLLLFLTEVLKVYYLFSNAVSFIVSLIFNYICSMRFVFKSKKEIDKRKEFFIFCILSCVGLGINQFIMWIMVEQMQIFYAITKIIVTVVVMIWNFVSRKIFLEDNSTSRE